MNKVTHCNKCDICLFNRSTPVWGHGNEQASVMFVGEAPGGTERRVGIPFVGAAGKALRRILDLYGFDSSNTYITNVVKCRPPNNRTPELIEIINCIPLLYAELMIVKPKIVVLLGNTALHTFTNDFSLKISKCNGVPFAKGSYVVIPMYHPSYLLQNPDKIKEFERAMDVLLFLYRYINPLHITKL